MDKKELQKKLSQPYSTSNWREVVKFVFPNVSLRDKPADIPVEPKFQDIIESFKQLGDVKLHDGKTLALLELKVKENVNIIRNRVRLNEIVSSVIDTENAHGVLSIFEKGVDDYRFTFSARGNEYDDDEGDFKTTKTDTKRFTYVLGKNESCKTPAQRFYDLSEHKDTADINAIEDAFSVEKLSKTFFKEYKDQYNAFVNYMMQTPGIFKAIYSEDDKAIRDFVKILLGRIIFIKFVQKKGWMGVNTNSKKWIDGDYRFLENGFTNFKHQDLFYSTFLEPLFDTLDEPNRPNDVFSVTQTRVPYLSGGLFELEDKKTKNINFPAKYFNDLFEFLDRYNFTIDENDANDHEVGIDPEMLGHIFENLLEDNKDKGAFYTPKEIVRYMCQESLTEYLKTSLENNKQWPTDETEAKDFKQALHNFVTKKEAGGIIEFEETIARALKEVKICDPAIGSGAFPMGLLNEIFQLVHKLHDANKDKVERVWGLEGWQPNKVKQNIIQNSIYGVDIEKGAVDVARLRFWLSLILDEPEPKALPHLDYKIVVGNSLVSKLDDTIINIDWEVENNDNLPETDLFGKIKHKQFNVFEVENNEKLKQLLIDISTKQKEVFDPNCNEFKLSLEIRNLKIDLLINQLDAIVKTKGVIAKPIGAGKNIKAQTELWLQTIGWKQQITKLKTLKNQPEGILHFFDWKLDFPEIMHDQVIGKIGFDIVIGNPPYLSISKLQDKASLQKQGFKTFENTGDIYSLFYEMGNNLLKSKGCLIFITSRQWINAGYGKSTRKYFADNTNPLKLIDFGKAKLFESATVFVNILMFEKNKNLDQLKGCLFPENFTIDKTNIGTYFDSKKIHLKNVTETVWKIGSEYIEAINQKIELKGIKLKDWDSIKFYAGIKTAYNPAFHINENIKNELIVKDKKNSDIIKPLLRGKDIKRYKYKFENIYLINTHNGIREIDLKPINAAKEYPVIFEHLNHYEAELKNRDDQGVHWSNLRNCAFLREFEKEKIVWIEISDKANYAYDISGMYLTNSAYFMSGSGLKYILGVLNSKVSDFYFSQITAKIAGGRMRYTKQYVEQIPIPQIKDTAKGPIVNLVNTILLNKVSDNDTYKLEQQIDNLAYKLYELTYDEVLVVEPEFSERMSREEYEVFKVE